MSGYLIRPMREADIDQVAQMEKEIYSDPWSKRMFLDHLNSPSSLDLTLETNEGIIGYACNTVIPEYLLAIDNLTIKKEFQKRGHGSILLAEIIQKGKEGGINTFTLEARESNQAAIALYSKFGFKVAGRRKRYYHSPVEDAIIMTREE
jgi:ribosomal-protein-alanine N-acetyltransferase